MTIKHNLDNVIHEIDHAMESVTVDVVGYSAVVAAWIDVGYKALGAVLMILLIIHRVQKIKKNHADSKKSRN